MDNLKTAQNCKRFVFDINLIGCVIFDRVNCMNCVRHSWCRTFNRKYNYEHVVQGNYGYGWDDLTSSSDTTRPGATCVITGSTSPESRTASSTAGRQGSKGGAMEKKTVYMAVDQYGQTFHWLTNPRKELCKRLAKSHADKMFVDGKDGKRYHVGYVIGGLWLKLLEVTPYRREVE